MECVVVRIVFHRKGESRIMYLRVRWFGYGPEEDKWEPLLQVPVRRAERVFVPLGRAALADDRS
jgi:hypothetical protein